MANVMKYHSNDYVTLYGKGEDPYLVDFGLVKREIILGGLDLGEPFKKTRGPTLRSERFSCFS